MAVGNGNRESVVKNTSAAAPSWRVLTWATSNSPPPPTVVSGDFLLIHVTYANNIALSSVTHDGDALTKAGSKWQVSPTGQRHEFWYLPTPVAGVKEIKVTFASSMYNGISVCAMCFSGASGIGTIQYFGESSTPHTRSVSVSADSMVYGTSSSDGTYTNMIMDGVTVLPVNLKPNQVNVNNIVVGALTTSPVSAGNINVTATAPSGDVSNVAIEIQASGSSGSTRRRIIIC